MALATAASTDPFADDFQDPTSGFDKIQDHAGELVIVKVTAYEDGLTTQHSKAPGDASAVYIDYIVITGDNAGKEVTGAMVYSGGLKSQFRRAIGKAPVLGKIAKTDYKKGEGWVFNPATDAEKATAREFLRARREAQIKAEAAKASEDPFS